jgi:hypothetical protein
MNLNLKTYIFHLKKEFQKGLIFLLLLSISKNVYGQTAVNVPEKISFHTPKTLYFTGEKIWYDASVTMGNQPSVSQVIYVELVDRNSVSITHTKVPLQNGKAINFLTLPSQLPSDHYLLRVYTRISPYLDMDMGIAQQLVTVINPRIPPKPSKNRVRVEISPDKSFSKGAEIKFSHSASNDSKKVISAISIANPFLPEEQKQLVSGEIYASLEKEALLPELFGHIVKVKVPQANPSLTYFLSVHGVKSALFTDHPTESGEIVFDIGGLRHWDRLIVQLEDGQEMPGLEVISPVIKTSYKNSFLIPELSLGENDLKFLNGLLKASMMQTYYLEETQKDSLEVVTGFVADHAYNLDDYTRFEDIETVLREYVPSVAVRTKDKKKEFRLLNEANKSTFDANPLILVDAMPVFDSDLLSSFNPKLLQRLEVLNREFYLNDRTYPGVLSFTSYMNNFGMFPLAPSARFYDYHGLQPLITLDKNQFTTSSGKTRFPDWRTVLFWGEGGGTVSTQAPALEADFIYWERETQDDLVVTKRTYFRIVN